MAALTAMNPNCKNTNLKEIKVSEMKDNLSQYINSSCKVYSMDNELLLFGTIRNILLPDGSGNELRLEIIPQHGTKFPIIKYATPLKLHIFNRQNGMIALGSQVYLSDDFVLSVINLETFINFERRAFFRIKANGKGFAKLQVPNKADTDDKIYEINVVNVSLSGVLIETDGEFNIGDLLEFNDFQINDNMPPILVISTVQRIISDKNNKTLYGCRFENLDPKTSDLLYSSINELQLKQIQEKKNRF